MNYKIINQQTVREVKVRVEGEDLDRTVTVTHFTKTGKDTLDDRIKAAIEAQREQEL